MTEPTHRAATDADIAEAARLFLTSVTDLARRQGLAEPPFTAASIEPVYRHIHRTGIFDVAELDGRIVAIAHAIVRDHLWFLSGFWTLPGLQRKGIGGPLLRRVRAEGERRGATLAFTWSSVDVTAMASYMKLGMLPGYPVLTFAGTPSALPAAGGACEEQPLTPAAAGDIDVEIRGTRRGVDHAFWLAGPGACRLVLRSGRPIGYHHTSRGVIGPAAWLDPADGPDVLALALHEARRQAAEVRIAVPGKNHTAIPIALAAGLQLLSFSHLLCTNEPGKMDRYVPSGPSLF
ncbi:MAG: GNAT family N-acetyltransferase [Polyangiaceae bacterium]|nr:GNAT family N-acetyltransferase [Polyangiaceae bacterium]